MNGRERERHVQSDKVWATIILSWTMVVQFRLMLQHFFFFFCPPLKADEFDM